MHYRSVRQLLESLPELQDLTRGTRRLLQLQQNLDARLPPGLRGHASVAGLSAGTLVISTTNGAVAAKVRQFSPRLLAHLRQLDPEVNAIQIRAQVQSNVNSLPQKQISLTVPASEALSQLARQLPESPLRHAVERLAKQNPTSSDD